MQDPLLAAHTGRDRRVLESLADERKRLRSPWGMGMVRAMRIRALLVAVLLGGCASGVGPSAGLPSVRPGPPPGRVRPVHPGDATTALLRAGTADAISVAEARAMLGPPDVERHDGVGALLVWTGPTCALALGFASDRLRTAEPGPRRTGDPPPGIQTCLAEIHARRTTPP